MKSSPARVCVPVGVPRVSELAAVIARAAAVGDLVELRLDYLEDNEREEFLSYFRDQLNHLSTPFVLTFRPAEQGGRTSADLNTRHRFWSALMSIASGALMDLELDLVLRFAAEEPTELSIDWSRIICSHHDFTGVPADLDELYERMAASPARIIKIAVSANDTTDCLPVFRLLERARERGRELIAIAMGQAGVMTRILGPACGSFLTYASLDDANANAPGQLTAKALRETYRLDHINQETAVFGLMGTSVGHSVSPHMHNAAFGAAGLDAVYTLFETHDANQFIRRMARPDSRELVWNLRGFSVTAPHKSAVMNSLDWIDPAAKEIGAVNTILIREHELRGYNTDAAGFISPLRQRLGSLKGLRCAVLGAGGGARAVLWALRREGAELSLFVRNPVQARKLSDEFGITCQGISTAAYDGFDVVVNATPLGTRGALEQETAVVTEQFRGVRLAYDLVYNPLETRFLHEARRAGCETLSGIEMLLAQAVEQFKIWMADDPDPEVMRAAAVRALTR